MKFTYEEVPYVEIRDLKPGECFMYCDCPYIKIEEIRGCIDEDQTGWNCAKLGTGSVASLNPGIRVMPLKGSVALSPGREL